MLRCNVICTCDCEENVLLAKRANGSEAPMVSLCIETSLHIYQSHSLWALPSFLDLLTAAL